MMEFRLDAVLPRPPAEVWEVLTDVPRVTGCIPGCENVEERERFVSYGALLKQKIGPFRLEVPAEIVVDEMTAPARVRARATGRDKITGTTLTVTLDLMLEPVEPASSRFAVAATLQVAGRLSSLGYPLVRKKAEENFAEFQTRLLATLGEGA